jgi:hypothetical protein
VETIKKITVFLSVFLLFSGLLFYMPKVSLAVAFDGGTGTEADPYQISTVEQLQWIANDPTANYTITGAVDCSNTSSWNGGAGFVPIGNASTAFTGSLDGGNHTLSELYINSGSAYCGLFGVTANASITCFDMEDCYIYGGSYTGAIAGYAWNTTINYVSVNGGILEGSSYVGGLTGFSNGYPALGVDYEVADPVSVHHIPLYRLESTGTASSYFYAEDATHPEMNGFGYGTPFSFNTNIFSTGTHFNISLCPKVDSKLYYVYIVDDNTGNAIVYLRLEANNTVSIGDNAGLNYTGFTWVVDQMFYLESVLDWGAQTFDYEIRTGVSSKSDTLGFYGAGNVITDIYMTVATSDGILAYGEIIVGEEFTFPSLITNSYSKLDYLNGTDYTGGITGYCKSTQIEDCYSIVNMDCNDYAGGIIGFSMSSYLRGFYTSGSITGRNYISGICGLVDIDGANEYATTIYHGVNYANVEGNNYVGGVLGRSTASPPSERLRIEYAGNQGAITGVYRTGGFGGHISQTMTTVAQYRKVGTIALCYNTGNVTTGTEGGGFIGYFKGLTLVISFSNGWLSGTSGLGGFIGDHSSDVGSYNGVISYCYTSTFVNGSGYGFYGEDNVIFPTTTGCYFDTLSCNKTDGGSSGTGVSHSNFIIEAQTYFSSDLSNYYVFDSSTLGRPFLSWMRTWVTYTGKIFSTLDLWLCNSSASLQKNLYHDNSTSSIWGSFGYIGVVNNNTINGQGYGVYGVRFYSDSTYYRWNSSYYGTFTVWRVNNGYITNMVFYYLYAYVGYIDVLDKYAGIVGYNSGNVSNIIIETEESITWNMDYTGLVSENNGYIYRCFNNASFSNAIGTYNGGICGKNSVSIRQCFNLGTITGYTIMGGLVGHNTGSIIDSYNRGALIGVNIVGGLVGQNDGTITNCYNTGKPSATGYKGGLVAVQGTNTVTYSFWNRDVYAYSPVGTGENTGTMQNYYTFASVGWDFTSVWSIDNGNDYPVLQWYYGDASHPADYEVTSWFWLLVIISILVVCFVLVGTMRAL